MSSARILAVDDDPHQLESLKRILKRSCFDVDTATNGRLGLRKAMQNMPDLILLDVAMPNMSGSEFVRRLRRLEKRRLTETGGDFTDQPFQEIPVIFVTALASPMQCVNGLEVGAMDYITKPFDADELRARIRNKLRLTRQYKEVMASIKAELSQTQSILSVIKVMASGCRELLLDLHNYLELSEMLRDPKLKTVLRERAQQDVQRLTQSLLRISECTDAKANYRDN